MKYYFHLITLALLNTTICLAPPSIGIDPCFTSTGQNAAVVLNKLRACSIHTNALQAEQAEMCHCFAREMVTGSLNACCIQSESLCTTSASINTLSVPSCAQLQSAGIRHLVAYDACFPGITRIYSAFSAHAQVTFDYEYPLGMPLVFDTVLSDPLHTLTPTSYIVPETGIYLITIQVVQRDLIGPLIIPESFASSLEMYADGIRIRQRIEPFIPYMNTQTVSLSSSVHLLEGEEIFFVYHVLALSAIIGPQEYPGRVIIGGAVAPDQRTFVSIQYLASDRC